MRPELVFLSPLVYYEHILVNFLARNSNLEYYFYGKYLNLKKIHTESEQTSRVHTKFQSSITPRKKRKSKKIFLILNFTLDQLFNDTSHISLR